MLWKGQKGVLDNFSNATFKTGPLLWDNKHILL